MPPLHRGLITILRNDKSSAASCIMDSFCRRPSVQAAACVHPSLIQQMAGLAGNMCPRALVHRKLECHFHPVLKAAAGNQHKCIGSFKGDGVDHGGLQPSVPPAPADVVSSSVGGWGVGGEGEGLRLEVAPLVSRASPRCSSGRQGLSEFRIKSLSGKVANFVLSVTYHRCTRRKRPALGGQEGIPVPKCLISLYKLLFLIFQCITPPDNGFLS